MGIIHRAVNTRATDTTVVVTRATDTDVTIVSHITYCEALSMFFLLLLKTSTG